MRQQWERRKVWSGEVHKGKILVFFQSCDDSGEFQKGGRYELKSSQKKGEKGRRR